MTTVHFACSLGTPSTTVDTAGAMDYDVTLTIGDVEIDGEITLVPSQHDGTLGSWGQPDHWISSGLLAEIRKLPESAQQAILAVLDDPEDCEIEIDFQKETDK